MIALRPVSEIDVVMADDVMLEGGSLRQEPGSLLIQPVWRWSKGSPCWMSIWGMRERSCLLGAWCRVSHVRGKLDRFRFLGLVRRFSTQL